MKTNNNRYLRQQQVEKIGLTGQKKLQRAQVVIIGLGGLGCPASLLLAGAGVGRLILVDNDTISLTNLHRQGLYCETDIGESKVRIAQQKLLTHNSDIKVISHAKKLQACNIAQLLIDADVVVDAADNFIVTYLLSDYCLQHRIPLVSASVVSTHGYIGVFCGSEEQPMPSVRAVFPRPPKTAQDCNTVGVTGPSVSVVGSLQAQEVLKILVKDDSQLLGKLLYLDLWSYRQSITDFSKAKEPTEPKVALLGIDQLTENDCVIDVRNLSEWREAPLPVMQQTSTWQIPLGELNDSIEKFPRNSRIICVCQTGQRALTACYQLIDAGYQQVAVLSVDFQGNDEA